MVKNFDDVLGCDAVWTFRASALKTETVCFCSMELVSTPGSNAETRLYLALGTRS
jgi:hypothetical protein